VEECVLYTDPSCSVCKPGEKLQETFDLCNCKQMLLYQILILIFSGVQILICCCIIHINSFKKSYIVIPGYFIIIIIYLFIYFYYVSHSGHAPTMAISDPSIISKWENLQNSRVFKYLFSSLYVHTHME